MDSKTIATIREMAGTKTAAVADPLSRTLINDLIKGAAANPRLQGVELGGALAGAGFGPFDLAKTAGVIRACDEAGLSVKQASEATGLHEDYLQAIVVVANGGWSN